MHVLLPIFHIFLILLVGRIHLIKHPDISSLVIISFISMTCIFDQVVKLQEEIRCLSIYVVNKDIGRRPEMKISTF